jgi:hypothetical protein
MPLKVGFREADYGEGHRLPLPPSRPLRSVPLHSPCKTAAFAAATTLLLASDAAFAAAADGDKKVAPPQADYGESTPLSLPSNEAPRQLDSAASSFGRLARAHVRRLAVVVAVIYGLYWILRQVKAEPRGALLGLGPVLAGGRAARAEPVAAPGARRP